MNIIRVIAARLQMFASATTSNCSARVAFTWPSWSSLWRAITCLLVSSWLTVATAAAPGVTVVGIRVDGATAVAIADFTVRRTGRSEEHTSELQSR